MKGILLGDSPEALDQVWSPAQRARLGRELDLLPEIVSASTLAKHEKWLRETEAIFSTWGMPLLSREQCDLMPALRAVFYAAGSVKAFAAPLLERDIIVVSGSAANAIPVAEFALSQILFALKQGWRHVRQIQDDPGPQSWKRLSMSGVYGATIGIISLGMSGRKLCELLRPFSVDKLAYDPFVTDEIYRELGVRRAATVEEIFSQSDVVTLHAPWLPETENLITGNLVCLMKPNATFINTSRGALVNEAEMIAVLERRADLTAVLDVTWPEPPEPDSKLYKLKNVILTPHIAGSMGDEVRRMSDWMIEEFIAWRNGNALRYAVSRESVLTSA